MLTNFFKKSKPITVVVLLGLFLGYFLLANFSGFSMDFLTNNSIISYLRYGLWIFLTFFFFNFIINKNKLTFDNAFAFLFFVLCLGMIPNSFLNEKTVIINLILLLFLRKVYSLQSSKNVFQKLFDGGLWLGIAFLIEPFSAIFLVLLYIANYVHQKFTLQTILIPVLGFAGPLFLYFTYCFWNDKTENFNQLFYWFTTYDFSIYNSLLFLIPLLIIGAFLLFSVVMKTPLALRVKNTFRKSWMLVLLHFITAFIFIVLIEHKNGSELLYLLFPTAVILANGLELLQKKWIADIVIALFFFGSLTVYFI